MHGVVAVMVLLASAPEASAADSTAPTPERPTTLVLVPEGDDASDCFVNESLASVMALTSELRVVRAPQGGLSLDAARKRVGADIAIAGKRIVLNDGLPSADEQLTLTLARAGAAEKNSQASGDIESAIADLWPEDAPPLPRNPTFVASSSTALSAICKNDAKAALSASGAAVGDALLRKITFEVPQRRRNRSPWMIRWGYGRALASSGKDREAITELQSVLQSLKRSDTAPTWRRAPRYDTATASVEFTEDIAIFFEDRRFVAIEPASGRRKWALDVGEAVPSLIDIGGDLRLVAANKEVVAVDISTGRVRWRLPVMAPAPEIARMGEMLFIAGRREFLALGRRDGIAIWRYEPRETISAGPVAVGGRVALPLETQILLFDPGSNAPRAYIDLADEIAGPVVAGDKSWLWAPVGGDSIVGFDVATAPAAATAKNLFEKPKRTPPTRLEPSLKLDGITGAAWPPTRAASKHVVAARDARRGPYVAFLDLQGQGRVERKFRGGLAPVVPLPDFSGILHVDSRGRALIARNNKGRQLWKQRFSQRIVDVDVRADRVWLAAGSSVIALDRANGKRLQTVRLDEDAAALAIGADDGAVVTRGGAIYGLPREDDPRPQFWLQRIRFELAEAYMRLGQTSRAKRMADEILERSPKNIDALALQAGISAGLSPSEANATWIALAKRTPRGDPLQQTAKKWLDTLLGVQTRLLATKPIRQVATSTDGAVVARTEDGVLVGITPGKDFPIWTHEGGELTGMVGRMVVAGRKLVSAKDGVQVRSLRALPSTLGRHGVYRINGEQVTREDVAGETLWKRGFEQTNSRVLADTHDHTLIADDSDQGKVHWVRADTGSPLWMRTYGTKLISATPSGDKTLLWAAGELIGIESMTGSVRFRANGPPAGKVHIIAIDGGWALASKKKLIILSTDKGRVMAKASLPEGWDHLAVPFEGGFAYVSHPDGTLSAISIDTGQLSSSAPLGPFDTLVAGHSHIIGIEKGGHALVVLDAKRGLSPVR